MTASGATRAGGSTVGAGTTTRPRGADASFSSPLHVVPGNLFAVSSRPLRALRFVFAVVLAAAQPWFATYTCCPPSEAVLPGGCSHARGGHGGHESGSAPAPDGHHKGPCVHCCSAPSGVLASPRVDAQALLIAPVAIVRVVPRRERTGPLLSHHLLPFATAPPAGA